MGGLEPLAEGLGGVGGAEALDRIAAEGLPCRLRHGGLHGGLVGVGGGADAHLPEGMHPVHPIVPSCSPGPPHPAAELLQSGGRPPGEVGGRLGGGGGVLARGPGAARGGRGPVVVVGVTVPGAAGAAVAEAGGGGRVRVEGGTGGGGGHGAAVARLVASGGAGVVVSGAGGGEWVWAGGERGARRGLSGEGEVDMGRQWRSWWRLGERERQERGPGGSWWHLGEREWREWVVEPRWRWWGVWAPGAGVPCGGGAGAPPFARPGLMARVGPVRRRRRVQGGFAWCRLVLGGGGGPLLSMDPPRRNLVAAAAGGMGRVTVLGGVGPRGPLRRGRGGQGDMAPGTGGVAGTGGVGPWW